MTLLEHGVIKSVHIYFDSGLYIKSYNLMQIFKPKAHMSNLGSSNNLAKRNFAENTPIGSYFKL